MNLSPDSFSDGGRYSKLDDALAHGRKLAAAGACAIDIGAVSSNPDSQGLPAEEELARLLPLVEHLKSDGLQISIDTFSPIVQQALANEVNFLNDIRGFPDPSVWPALASSPCNLVLMHALQRGPADRRASDPDTIVDAISTFFEDRLLELTKAGIAEHRILLDPGMGFFLGNHPDASFAVLRALPLLSKRFGLPVLVSVSRKSFLGTALGGRPPNERAAATLSAELYAARGGVEYIRTHDVLGLTDALTIEGILSRG